MAGPAASFPAPARRGRGWGAGRGDRAGTGPGAREGAGPRQGPACCSAGGAPAPASGAPHSRRRARPRLGPGFSCARGWLGPGLRSPVDERGCQGQHECARRGFVYRATHSGLFPKVCACRVESLCVREAGRCSCVRTESHHHRSPFPEPVSEFLMPGPSLASPPAIAREVNAPEQLAVHGRRPGRVRPDRCTCARVRAGVSPRPPTRERSRQLS